MFANIKNIYLLLIANEIDSSKEDVRRLKILLEKVSKKNNIHLMTVIKENVYCKNEVKNFVDNLPKVLDFNDLLYIHYSGHGTVVGKKINNKIELVSTWKSPDSSLTYDYEIDEILSNLKCKIFLSSDSCHSGNFGKKIKGASPFIFIGTSSLIQLSSEYSISNNKNSGALVIFLEYFLNTFDINFPVELLEKEIKLFFKKNKIRHFPTIRFSNI